MLCWMQWMMSVDFDGVVSVTNAAASKWSVQLLSRSPDHRALCYRPGDAEKAAELTLSQPLAPTTRRMLVLTEQTEHEEGARKPQKELVWLLNQEGREIEVL